MENDRNDNRRKKEEYEMEKDQLTEDVEKYRRDIDVIRKDCQDEIEKGKRWIAKAEEELKIKEVTL